MCCERDIEPADCWQLTCNGVLVGWYSVGLAAVQGLRDPVALHKVSELGTAAALNRIDSADILAGGVCRRTTQYIARSLHRLYLIDWHR